MTSSLDTTEPTPTAPAEGGEGLTGLMARYVTQAISDADMDAAAGRVAQLRAANLNLSTAELVDLLVRHKCWQTGTIGAVTSGLAIIPGLGTLAAITFGVAADIGMTFKLQAELVLEIAAAHGHSLSLEEKRRIILTVTGVSAGVNQVLQVAGKRVAVKATQLLAEKAIVKAIPILGVAASAGINAVTTYWIGRRAQAYFSLGAEDMQDWPESARAISGVDERRVSDWLAETTQRTWEVASAGAQTVAGAVVVAGKFTGEIIVVGADRVKEASGGLNQGVVTGVSSATGAVTEAGQWAGETITAMAGTAAAGVAEIGRWMSEILGAWLAQAGQTVNQGLEDLLKNMGAAADSVTETDQKTEADPTAAAGAATTAVVEAGQWVGDALTGWAGAAQKAGEQVTALVSGPPKAGETPPVDSDSGIEAGKLDEGEVAAQG